MSATGFDSRTVTTTNTKKIRAIIVDDEPPARRNLRALLKRDPEIEVVKECGNGKDAVSSIRALAPDLVFLDVQMPEMDGFAVLDNLAGHPLPVIIFVTAYDQYALKAFEVSALDYLLKPFSDERFRKALAQAKQQIERQDASEFGKKMLTLIGARELKPDAPRYLTRLMVKTAGRVIFIRTEEIDWIEAYDNYIRLHVGGKSHLLRQTMNELEAALNPEQFARIHRSTIVNLDRIKELHPHFNGEHLVILHDGTELKLSRSRKEWLEQWLGAGAG
ncbi:MAG: LytR/AlgR family response regulator transcription factor [Blastocatellales bacterium]